MKKKNVGVHIQINDDLYLRSLTQGDANEVFSVIDENREHLSEWLTWLSRVKEVKNVEESIYVWTEEYKAMTDICVGIFNKNRYVGNIGLHGIETPKKDGEMGFWLAKSEQGQGIITTCCRHMTEYAFETLGLNKIFIRFAQPNFKARHVAERMGYVQEGILRDNEFIRGKHYDLVMYGMLKREWHNLKHVRKWEIKRKTTETDINMTLLLDGRGQMLGNTQVRFFDHMLMQSVKHGCWDLNLEVTGDTDVDCHHTIEDIGIVLGTAIKCAFGSKWGINRYGNAIIPMDEALVLCAVDLSGRPSLTFDIPFTSSKLGDMDSEMIKGFFKAISDNAEINIHLKLLSGENNHHIAEAAFKAFGRAMKEAAAAGISVGVPSTKGVL